MTEHEPLRRRYMRRFGIGIFLLSFLAAPIAWLATSAVANLENRPPDWVPDTVPEKIEFNDFLRRFQAAELVMLSWEGATLGSESLEQATTMLRPLAADSPAVAEADLSGLPNWVEGDLASIQRLCRSDQPLHWVRSGTEMLEQMTSAPARLPRAVAIGRLQGSVVGPTGEQTCLVLSLSDAALRKRREFLPRVRTMVARLNGVDVAQIAMVGGPFEGAVVDDESVRSVELFAPPSAIVAAILCFLCLRSIPLTIVITGVAVFGEGLVLALVALSGTPMNAVLVVLPPLVFVLTVSAGIHLSNYYLDASREFPELSRTGATSRAMRAGVIPCILATATTVIGLGSLMLVEIEPIRVFGCVSSIGVTATLLMLFLVLPGAMLFTKVDPSPDLARIKPSTGGLLGFKHSVDASLAMLFTKVRKRLTRPWPIIVAFGLFAIALASGLFKLQTSVNIPRMFQPESDLRVQYRWFEQHVAPTVVGELLIKFPPASPDDDPIQRLEIVKQAHLAASEYPQIDGVLSPLTFVPPIPTGRSFSSTATRSVIRALLRDPESSLGQLGFISRDEIAEVWRISLRMPQSESTDYQREMDEIKALVASSLAGVPDAPEVVFTGSIAIVQKAQEVLLRDLFRSFLAAFGIVALVMAVLLRSILGGLIAMLPNLFPTIALFGFMGLIDMPLDIGSVMTASVALGIAVDDTIHLLSRFGSRRQRGLGQIRAAWGALGQCGWAMLQTTTVCGLSLLVYWYSDFVPTSRFALLMFGLLSAALLGDLLLLPALMCSSLGRWLAKPVGVDPGAELSHRDQPRPPADHRRLRRKLTLRREPPTR